MPLVVVGARRHDGLSNVVDFLPVAFLRPMSFAPDGPLHVLFQRVVLTVEQVLAVKLHEGEDAEQKGGDAHSGSAFILLHGGRA